MDQLAVYLIVCPLVFVAGFIDAIAGGGGLISLPAYLIAGLPVHSALGTNKLSSCMGTALATLRYARHGFVNVRRSLACATVALVGSAVGANVALLIDDRVFKVIMLIVVPLTALYVLRRKGFGEQLPPLSSRRTLAVCMASSLALGLYDGLYGPGTGTFLMVLFMSVAHLSLDEAAGTCKVVNLTTNVAALVVFVSHGTTLVTLGLVAGAFNMVGAWLGSGYFMGKGIRAVKPVMLTVLVIFFVKLAGELAGIW